MIASAMTFASCNYDELNDALEHAIERSWYGNWCGPMHSGPDDPVDEMDSYCKIHDECYATWGIAGDVYYECIPGKKVDCDNEFVDHLKNDLEANSDLWSPAPPAINKQAAEQYRIDAIKLFGGCVDLFK